MKNTITNNTGISLALAVWLVHDEYDYSKEENYISATALMKPLRQIVLGRRVPPGSRTADVEDFIPRALGHSVHDSVEKAWVKGYKTNLAKLGYPQDVIDRILVNATPEELAAIPNAIAVYVEQRALKKVKAGGITWTVGGKFDMVTEGIVQDTKTTSAYTWVYGGRDDEHQLQGSIYRWLNPDKIYEDFIRINYIFTDWQKAQTKQNPKYPKQRVEHKDIPLLEVAATENWVVDKLTQVLKFMEVPEKDVPLCSEEDLWMSDPKFKYYANPANTGGRSTKNFDTEREARAYQAEKAGKGIVIIEKGEPKRCDYCDAFDLCKQKDQFPKYQPI